MEEVYLLYETLGTDMQIYGIFTDTIRLLEAYNTLLKESVVCSVFEEGNQKPGIYKMQLNRYLDPKGKLFFHESGIQKVSIEEVYSKIKIAEFCGFTVCCNLGFPEGPIYEVAYEGEDNYVGVIDAGTGTIVGDFDKYVEPVLKEWLEDNKEFLLEIWKSKKPVMIPDWE